jgi:DNA-binding beta-propeller fold protein YncE
MTRRLCAQAVGGALLGLGLTLLAGPASAQAADCNRAAKDAVLSVALPGVPSAVVATPDGCTIFVSLPSDDPKRPSAIAVLSRRDGEVSLLRRVEAKGRVGGLALTADGGMLAASTGGGVALFDTARLVAGQGDPLIADVDEGAKGGSLNVAFSRDDRLLFVANSASKSIGVFDPARLARHDPGARRGDIPVGEWPAGMALSPDGRWLYATVLFVEGKPTDCGPPDGQTPWVAPGELAVIDVAKAASSPATAVVARVAAGCGPARVAVSPSGDVAYVTAQGDGAVQVIRTDRLLTDPAHAVAGRVEAGAFPVGIATTAGSIFVTTGDQTVSLLDAGASARRVGAIPVGGSPGNASLTADSRALLVTSSKPNALEIVDLARLDQFRR